MGEDYRPALDFPEIMWFNHPDFKSALESDPGFSRSFRSWSMDPGVPFLIGNVPIPVADYLSVPTQGVFLSSETFKKQLSHHPEIVPDYYAVVPVTFREGEVYQEEVPGKVQFLWEAGAFGFEATVKRTSKEELFLVSFFRAARKRMKRTRQKFQRVL
jgi:hypothetical protein